MNPLDLKRDFVRLWETLKSLALSLAIAISVAWGIVIVIEGYKAIDSTGLILHRQETAITADGNWLVGESKNCASYPLTPKDASALGKTQGTAVDVIHCGKGPQHRMEIRFYGRMEQPEYLVVAWEVRS